MSFKYFNRFKIVFYHLKLRLNEVNTVFLYKHCVKYKYASRAVCAYVHVFGNDQGVRLLEHVR